MRHAELTRVPASFLDRCFATRTPQVLSERMAVGWRVIAAEPITTPAEVDAIVFVTVFLPEHVEDLLGQLARRTESWKLFKYGASRCSGSTTRSSP
ncbi:MAG: hypothetical protein HC882_08535 [Acidobacteria bacterium]|nr:hypothetical protein [Acidobacteriota bacterium]